MSATQQLDDNGAPFRTREIAQNFFKALNQRMEEKGVPEDQHLPLEFADYCVQMTPIQALRFMDQLKWTTEPQRFHGGDAAVVKPPMRAYAGVSKTITTEHGTRINISFGVDGEQRPAGGTATVWVKQSVQGRDGTPDTIDSNVGTFDFQNGPIGEEGRNGGFIEDLLEIARERLDWYQSGQFACRENACAKTKIDEALMWLNERTRERRERGVEGTHSK